ncbi:hypothetical protein [Micromonospora aurantiaca (nom. illeg.)]|uniref:hypothetical protein n=1 Tax=Micromonospora aurantiaca (nom. illeg.) TaxID=47850 RepID=UPI003EBD3C9B
MELASEDCTGAEPVDSDAEVLAEVRQQLADLDALAPYAAKLSSARLGLSADEQERLLTVLGDIVTAPAALSE